MAENESQHRRRKPKKDECCVAKQEQLLKVDYAVTFCVEIEECEIINVTCMDNA